MIPLAQAQAHVLERCQPLGTSQVPAAESLGLIIAEPIVCGELVPPFDNTAVDGFAVHAADTQSTPVTLPVIDTIAAGQAPSVPLDPGTAIRIMTGAPLPAGADAVVMVEDTEPVDGGTSVTINATVPAGAAVRGAGEDMTPGQTVFEPGTDIGPGHIGILATLGIETVTACRRPRVGVMSTGDELVEGPVALAPGQIRDSNRHSLLALLAESGFDAVDLGLIADDEVAVEAALRSGAAECDAVVTSGGVSMGDFDYVKSVLARIADMTWMQVAIKPAKPLAFGLLGDTPIFGLPGNPVSSMVSYELFARPGLRRMAGRPDDRLHRPRLAATAESALPRSPDGKTHFARVRVRWNQGSPVVRSAGGQGSHQLSAMADADALAAIPDGTGLAAGEAVDVMLLRPL